MKESIYNENVLKEKFAKMINEQDDDDFDDDEDFDNGEDFDVIDEAIQMVFDEINNKFGKLSPAINTLISKFSILADAAVNKAAQKFNLDPDEIKSSMAEEFQDNPEDMEISISLLGDYLGYGE